MVNGEELLTSGQAARVIGISANGIRYLLRAGRLDHTLTPLGRLIDPRSLAELQTKRLQRPAARRRALLTPS